MSKIGLRITRYDIVFFIAAVMLAGLGVKLGFMIHARYHPVTEQQKRIAALVEKSSGGQKVTILISGRPGNIYGSNFKGVSLMAGSREVPSCFVDLKIMSPEQTVRVCETLSNIFDIDVVELRNKFLANQNRRFVWVYREMTPQQKQALDEAMVQMRKDGIRGVGVLREWRREYPYGNLAGTVIGFCLKDNSPGGGLELKRQNDLRGTDGRRVLWADVHRRGIRPIVEESSQPTDGGNVYLTIDVNIQKYLQDAVAESVERFGAQWGTGIVVDPQTGDILAMCSAPTFAPNHFNTTPAENMLNRAVAMPYEPGSIFKPIIAAQAVQDGTMTYQTMIDCEGGVYSAPRHGRISDHGSRYNELSLRDVIVRSSNIGMAKVGEAMGNERLWQTVRHWGFGRRTKLGLPGESPGIVRPLRKWDGYSTWRIPFGQEISTSALQLVMGFSVFANGGKLLQPNIVRQVTDAKGKITWKPKPQDPKQVLSPDVAAATLAVLQDVVEDPHGTGKKCRIENWTSWGKTGTAQISNPTGIIPDAYVGSFIGAAPAKNTKVICLISIYYPDRQRGYYGGTVAAPYVKGVLEKTLTYLKVPSDR
ncbi:MAG: penicillin-binding protein 2 [Phycisphaerae bacterium]|nr:penicillin-binding protein 2 [Phycisphaerae bacterium]